MQESSVAGEMHCSIEKEILRWQISMTAMEASAGATEAQQAGTLDSLMLNRRTTAPVPNRCLRQHRGAHEGEGLAEQGGLFPDSSNFWSVTDAADFLESRPRKLQD